jgi:hypothetical protein
MYCTYILHLFFIYFFYLFRSNPVSPSYIFLNQLYKGKMNFYQHNLFISLPVSVKFMAICQKASLPGVHNWTLFLNVALKLTFSSFTEAESGAQYRSNLFL